LSSHLEIGRFSGVPLHLTSAALGQAVRELRAQQHRTIEDVAHAASIHPTSLSRIERGVINPTWEKVGLIAVGLHVTASELVRRAERVQAAAGPV
jgi:transcriptional regulator with XRE-family HTH domain